MLVACCGDCSLKWPHAKSSRRSNSTATCSASSTVALIAATTALVALIWLTQSLRFVELVVNRGLSMRVFFQLTGLLIPNFVAVILPITLFVVVQFVYRASPATGS